MPGPRTGAPIDQFGDIARSLRILGPGGPHQPGDILHQILAHRHAADELLNIDDGPARQHFPHLRLLRPGGGHQDLLLLRKGGVADLDIEHESIELGFGQRIGALLLDWILRGDRKEGIGEGIRFLADRNLPFLHRLQERRLGFGGSAVDFVGQKDVGEYWPLDEAEAAAAMLVLVEHIGAGDV